jgi:hypothetical protein
MAAAIAPADKSLIVVIELHLECVEAKTLAPQAAERIEVRVNPSHDSQTSRSQLKAASEL